MVDSSGSHVHVTRSRAAKAILCAVALVLLAGPAVGDKPTGEKRRAREIGIMERTIDEVLVESKNLLVVGRSVTQGFYLEGVGAVFTFSMDVIPLDWGVGGASWWDGSQQIEVDDEGGRIVSHKFGRDDDEGDKGEKSERKERKSSQSRDEAKKTARERYTEGKAELVDALLDYGAETLHSLADGEWVVLAARVSGGGMLTVDVGVSRLVIRAKVGELRSLDSGTLTRDAARGRIQIDES